MSSTGCYYVSASSHLPFTEYVSDISDYVEKIKKDNCLPSLVGMNMPNPQTALHSNVHQCQARLYKISN